MKPDWICTEKLTAVAAGCAGIAMSDPGTIASGVVAGAGLMGLWNQAKLNKGLESEKLLELVRKQTRKGFDEWAEGIAGAEADVNAADKAMAKHLADCVPPVEELAKTTWDDEDFPAYATQLIVARLGEKDAIFDPASDIHVPVSREFAMVVVREALTAAKSKEPFMQRLAAEVVLLIPQHLQRIEGKVDAGFAQLGGDVAEIKAMLQEKLGIPIEVLGREIADILQRKPVSSFDELYEDLRAYKQKHDDLQAQLNEVLVIDNRIAALKADADKALKHYDHDAVDRIYGEMREVEDERAADSMRRSANYADGQAKARMLKRDWQGAFEVWGDAADKLAPFDRRAAGALWNTAALALVKFGEDFPGGALEAAIDACRAALELLQREHWAAAQNNLGNALKVQGERSGGEEGIAALAKSVAAYRAALEVYTRDAQPAKWAATQNNLGGALRVQGERSGGDEGIALLAQSVSAYRAALEVRTRDAQPEQWAATQNNLGIALLVQGKRGMGDGGIALTAEAASAYRAALEVYSHDAQPSEWATTQNNLGAALRVLGERSGGDEGIALLAQSVSAYRAALEVRTRDAQPAQWAMTQNNLGIALLVQGRRSDGDEGIDLIKQSVSAFRAASNVNTRNALPADWAMTQNNLGAALRVQGQRSGGEEGIELLKQADTAYRAALEVRTRNALPAQWAMTNENIAITLLTLAAVDADRRCSHLFKARRAVENALSVYTPEHMPYDHSSATKLLSEIQAQIAEHCSEGSPASEGV